jgi:hypothetical protein
MVQDQRALACRVEGSFKSIQSGFESIFGMLVGFARLSDGRFGNIEHTPSGKRASRARASNWTAVSCAFSMVFIGLALQDARDRSGTGRPGTTFS